MTIPNDVARCAGSGSDADGWREGCEDCQPSALIDGLGSTNERENHET